MGSTLLSRSIYDKFFYPRESDVDKIMGIVLFRDEETTFNFSYYKPILRDYVNYNIRKNFGMSLHEYLELTPYEKLCLDEFAEECNKIMQEELKSLDKKKQQMQQPPQF